MSQPTFERILSHLERLGFWRSKDALPETLKQAETESWGYAQLLDRVLEDEVAHREERRVKNSLKLAGFASSVNQRHNVVSPTDATRPRRITSRFMSGILKRDSGRPLS